MLASGRSPEVTRPLTEINAPLQNDERLEEVATQIVHMRGVA